MSKYQFTLSATVDFNEASREIEALAVGGATLVVGGVAEIGIVLAKGLTLAYLVPIPISVLIAASIGAALADYYAVSTKRSKKAMASALENYLLKTQQQFIRWFDEVENYFNSRVDEIKNMI